MTPSLLFRPVLALLLTAGLGACGMVDSDPHRFENLAERVAAVPLDGEAPRRTEPVRAATPVRTAGVEGLRPALRVEVLDPHALWDARDGLVQQTSARVAEAAAPVMVEAVTREASARVQAAMGGSRAQTAEAAPALRSAPASSPRAAQGLVQLGAYSSREAAAAAWDRLKSGGAAWALEGLSPTYEAVQLNGRDLVRLKVRAPGAGAAALCAAAGVDDPWCRRAA